jgi:DNA polymerase III subunit epsilon
MPLAPKVWHNLNADDYRDILRACDRAEKLLQLPDVLIIDTETTDLNGEIVQIAMIDTQGQVVLDTLVRPQSPVTPGAYAIHHISNTMLRTAHDWAHIAPQFASLAVNHLLVSYNAPFDESMVRNSYTAVRHVPVTLRWECAMRLYARYVRESSPYGGCKWVSLPGGDHSALGDTRATLEVLQLMAADCDRLKGIVSKLQASKTGGEPLGTAISKSPKKNPSRP